MVSFFFFSLLDRKEVFYHSFGRIPYIIFSLQIVAATIFAYGQTSSGKTYTMRGITEKAVNDIYMHIINVSLLMMFSSTVLLQLHYWSKWS